MRLLKLIAYGLFGYALYEFVRGMIQLEQQQNQGGGGGRSMGGGQQRRVESFGGQQNMTGPAEGQEVVTQDADGGGMKHKVGRGVVSR
jgi:hypothetical protein